MLILLGTFHQVLILLGHKIITFVLLGRKNSSLQLNFQDLDLAPECLHVVEAEHANVGEQWLEGVAALLLEGQALLDLEQRKDFTFIVVDCSNARIIVCIMQGLKLNYLYLGFNPKKKFISICWFKVLPEGWLLFDFILQMQAHMVSIWK